MTGKRLQKARKEFRKYVTKSGWQEDIILSTANGLVTIETTAWHTKHHLNLDSDGLPINSKNAHICLSEEELTEKGYPVRNEDKEVHLYNHKVTASDSSGQPKEYVIKEWLPSETFGMIVCILGDYESNC